MSFALAGYLDLNIFCLSLADQSITEEDLFSLFNHLSEQCVVLLEDIDSAGLKKRDNRAVLGIDDENDTDGAGQFGLKAKHDPDQSANNTIRVSLSGLLNVIDGVASHEGRILIMTTNDVNALDKALLRPSRIDVKIKFGMASKVNAYDLFVQTFMSYSRKSIDETAAMVPKSLAIQAERFSSQLPEDRFTPAEIQGYLLSWKNNPPEDAVDNVKAWIDVESENKK